MSMLRTVGQCGDIGDANHAWRSLTYRLAGRDESGRMKSVLFLVLNAVGSTCDAFIS